MAAIDKFIKDPELLLASICNLCGLRGQRNEVLILANSKAEIVGTPTEYYDVNVSGYVLRLYVDMAIYKNLKEQCNDIAKTLEETAIECLTDTDYQVLEKVEIRPQMCKPEDWRQQANLWAASPSNDSSGDNSPYKLTGE